MQYPPSRLVERIFDDTVFCQPADEALLFEMVGQLISLERRSFLAAMRAIRSYVTGLHRLADDYELAYTLLVVSIESLEQQFDDFQPEWQDYDPKKRRVMDQALVGADESLATQVREALLKTEHMALTRRFREFALGHLRPSYFREEAQGLVNPMGRSDLVRALNQAYDLRSKYIHELAELPSILTVAGRRDTVSPPFKRGVMLTFQGLARLARHVITTFIQRQPKVEREEYDYSQERAGILHMQMAPQYWIGDTTDLDCDSGRERLEGFLQQTAACVVGEPGAKVTDLREVLNEVERMLPRMNAEQRRSFIALYVLFNRLALQDERMTNYDTTLERYENELDHPSLEAMLTFLLLNEVPDWTLKQHQEIHDEYFQQKNHRHGLRVPPALETGLSLYLSRNGTVSSAMLNKRGDWLSRLWRIIPVTSLCSSLSRTSTLPRKSTG